jgi:3-phenylpropionate/trans-cinnamate dioxygenase ferredoxin component
MAEIDLQNYQFFAVAGVDEVPSGDRLFLEIGSEPVVVFNIAGHYFAIGDICTHDGGPLGDGDLDGYQVICPRHGARFDIRSGKVLSLPAVEDAPSYPVRVVDGQIEIGVPNG